MNTSELTGAALDWAVAKCEGYESLRRNPHRFANFLVMSKGSETLRLEDYSPSTDWAQGGPIIEREMLCINPDVPRGWMAITNDAGLMQFGPTPLIAAMRCYVASKLRDEVQIPEELQ